ncbi:hybrid sensor histidine kinase/response regulator [Methylobacterium sp. ID0610]|uniref:hybrid sensor histidine kinase/response regulator n=1 Tax=Methylobacterium carpenticola TaxID=3344827 RepID=UPI0036BA7F31
MAAEAGAPWLVGGGALGTLIAERDWSDSPLGIPARWPAVLTATVGLMLPAHAQIVLFWGPDYVALYNDAYAPTIGSKHPRALGRPARENWSELWDDLEPLLRRVRETGETVFAESRPFYIERHGFGETVHFDISYSPVRMPDATVGGVLCIVAETTGRVRAEAALRESEARFRTMADHAPVMMWVTDATGACTYLNRAWYGFTGQAPAQGAGFGWLDAVHPDDRRAAADAFDTARACGGPFRLEYRLRHRDGRYRWVLDAGAPRFAPGEADLGFVGSIIDIDDQVRAREALTRDHEALEAEVSARTADLQAANARLTAEIEERTRIEEALRQAQKMEAVGQLTGGIAHDFNNLLTGIVGALDLMQTRLTEGRTENLGRYLGLAMTSAQRAAALTHRLLAFSRRQTLDPKPTDVNRLVEGLEDLIRRTVGPQIVLSLAAAPDLWTARVDPNQLENALLNLCINARDAMPEGGRITIATANRNLDAAAARVCDLAPGPYLTVEVRDTGTGMTPDVVARAFDPFFTTKPLGQGTGLGLSMIYGFARQSGGQVRIISEPGRGTTVRLYLPRHDGGAWNAVANGAAFPSPRAGAGETVLIVDDEPSVRVVVADVLLNLGYRILEAADSAAGLHCLQGPERIDLLVTDVGLPGGMNGRQLAEAGCALRPGLKVLMITGFAETAATGAGDLPPGMQVMTKPFALDSLAARVKDLIG